MHFNYKRAATEAVFFLTIGILLIGIGQKAFGISITNDEAYSYFLVKTNFINALVGTANTHWLNSFFIKLQILVLGNEVWMWRLHLLFFFGLYLLAARVIALKYFDGVWTWIVFFLLAGNPYLNDFFSIARGYGPAVALMCWAVYFFAGYFQQPGKRSFLYGCLCASLAVISNYTLLYFFLPAGLLVVVMIAGKKFPEFTVRENKAAIFITVSTFLFAAANLLFIKYYTGDLETGGDESLIYDTIGSLIKNFSYGYITATPVLAGWILILSIVLLFVVAVVNYWKIKQITLFHFVNFVLVGALMIGILFHLLFQTPFNEGRTAIYLYPLIILSISTGIEFIVRNYQLLKNGIAVLLLACSLSAAVFSMKAAYTDFCFETRDQVGIDQVMLELQNRYTAETTIALPSWHYGVHVNYYQLLNPGGYAFRTLKYEYPKTGVHTDSVIAVMKQSDVVVLYPAKDTAILQQAGFLFTNLAVLKKSNVVLLIPVK